MTMNVTTITTITCDFCGVVLCGDIPLDQVARLPLLDGRGTVDACRECAESETVGDEMIRLTWPDGAAAE